VGTCALLGLAAASPASAQELPSLPADVVAQVGEVPIPQSEFNRLASIAAQSGYGPGSVFDPPHFKVCIQQGLGQPSPKNRKLDEQQVKKRCQHRFKAIRSQVMTFLVQAQWIEQEAASLGVVVTPKQTRRRFERQRKLAFPKLREYRRFLRRSGQRDEDILYRVRLDLLQERLARRVEASAPRVTGKDVSRYHARHRAKYRDVPRNRARRSIRKLLTSRREQSALSQFMADFHPRYKAITKCAESYFVADCGTKATHPLPTS
jgi:hypothetical protein